MTATQELERHEPLEVERIPPAPPCGNSPTEAMGLLRLAIEQKLQPEAIERLYNLVERATKDQAKREFIAAKCEFQAEVKAIKKTGESGQFKKAARDGGTEAKRFLELDFIADTIRPFLHKHGFTFRWDEPEPPTEQGLVACVCWVSHKGGHEEPTKFYVPIERNNSTSGPQQFAIAAAYAKRYSLVSAFGLTGTERDNDGYYAQPEATNGGGEPQRRQDNGPPYVTEAQVQELENLLKEVEKTPQWLFAGLKVQARRLYDLREPQYLNAKERLEAFAFARLQKKSEAELKNGIARQPGEEATP